MTTDDWGTAAADWQPVKRKQNTFRQDLAGLSFHLAMVGLISFVAVFSWQTFAPKPVLQIQIENIK